jgi:predicted DNA repair protein MutK
VGLGASVRTRSITTCAEQVARGSLSNKCILLVPTSLILQTVAPWSIGPLLMAGGAYLALEAVETIAHRLSLGHGHEEEDPNLALALTDPAAFKALRVSGAIRADLILSAEIVAITLRQVVGLSPGTKVALLCTVPIIVTNGVYGIVAGLIKLDDLGEAMFTRGRGSAAVGRLMLRGTPWLMRAVGWVGALAMLLAGGHLRRKVFSRSSSSRTPWFTQSPTRSPAWVSTGWCRR